MIEIKGKEIRNVEFFVESEDIIKYLYDVFGFNPEWNINKNNEAYIEVEDYCGSHSSFDTHIVRKMSEDEIKAWNAIKVIEETYKKSVNDEHKKFI